MAERNAAIVLEAARRRAAHEARDAAAHAAAPAAGKEGAAEQAIEMPLEVPKPAEVISGLAEQGRNNKVSRPGSAATRSDAPSFFRRGGNSMGGAL